jgi:hypothetical protein
MALDNMEGIVESTPLPNKRHTNLLPSDPVSHPLSSSPAFATPLPLLPTKSAKPTGAASRLSNLTKSVSNAAVPTPTVISVRIDPPALRQLAVRVFKRHNLNIAGAQTLPTLANFVGIHCGAGWKDDGLADGVLDEVARLWKASRPRDPLVREEGGLLAGVLKIVAGMMVGGRVKRGLSRQSSFADSAGGEKAMLSRQTSFGMSSLGITGEEEEDELEKEVVKDPREWLKVVDAFEQPRLVYNVGKRHFERYVSRLASRDTDFSGPRKRHHCFHLQLTRPNYFDRDITLFINAYFVTHNSTNIHLLVNHPRTALQLPRSHPFQIFLVVHALVTCCLACSPFYRLASLLSRIHLAPLSSTCNVLEHIPIQNLRGFALV